MIRQAPGAALLLVLPFLLVQPQPAAGPTGAKIWVGRYQEIEGYLRTAECVNMEVFKFAARCSLRPGGPVARMAWRSLPPGVYRGFRESYKAEIAAYEVDKLLKLDMVPPSVERRLDDKTGAAQLWVENVVDSKSTTPDESIRNRWENELARMTMFDNLIGYRDRNTDNMLHDSSWNLILIDHSRAFSTSTDLPRKMTRIDATLWKTIADLPRSRLEAALSPWLSKDEIDAVIERREKMKAEIKSLPGSTRGR
jgi:hypothetical protein